MERINLMHINNTVLTVKVVLECYNEKIII